MDTTFRNTNLQEIKSAGELKHLVPKTDGPCVSIYMPLHRPGTTAQEDAIRLAGLLRHAHELLAERGFSTSAAEDLLKPVREILKEDLFWQHPGDGLAIFISQDTSRYYWIPLQPRQMVIVGKHLHIVPLLPLFMEHAVFYTLALSLNEVRLLRSTPHSSMRVELPKDVPRSLAEVLKYDDFEQQHQLYTGTPGWGGGKLSRPGAVFYGQGVGSDVEKDSILRYFQKVDKGLHPLLSQETAPLVVAGVDYLLPIYREANSYPHLIEEGIAGNPDHKSEEELREEAWAIAHPLFEKAQHEAIDRYMQFIGTGQTSDSVEEIVPAAYHGQVDTLFVASGAERWGAFDPITNVIEIHEVPEGPGPGDEDLLNLAALYTLWNQGTVYTLLPDRVPDRATLAALLRY